MKTLRPLRLSRFENLALAGVGLLLALLLRYTLRTFASGDFNSFTGAWYAAIKAQGTAFFAGSLSNYTPPYLYCLYLVSRVFPNVSDVAAVKLPAIAADLVCAGLVYRIVRLNDQAGERPWALFAFLAVLFAPTVVLNSSFWGQDDSLYTAALVACVYFLLVRRKAWALAAFGVAFAFKLQAVFLAPLLLSLMLRREVPWRLLAWIPLVYLIAIVPAWLAGRPIVDLLTIYPAQADFYAALTKNAPTLYAWLPQDLYPIFSTAGLVGALCVCFLFAVAVYKSRVPLTGPILVQLALVSVMLTPFVLPKMHERYFYPADVLSIVFGFYYPRYFFIPILVSLVSFFAYQPFLFGMATIPLPYLALAELLVIVVLARQMLIMLYPRSAQVAAFN